MKHLIQWWLNGNQSWGAVRTSLLEYGIVQRATGFVGFKINPDFKFRSWRETLNQVVGSP